MAANEATKFASNAKVLQVHLPPRASRGWWQGLVAEDGRIYCPPDGATTVLVVEPTSEISNPKIYRLPRPDGDGFSWSRGTLNGDGTKIFAAPFNAQSVLVIDIASQKAFAHWLPPQDAAGKAKWSDPALAGGRLYTPPFEDANSALCIDDQGGQISHKLSEPLPKAPGPRWTRGVLGPDNCLYCGPLAATGVLRIDPVGFSTKILGNLGEMQGKWNEGVLGPDGVIYYSPDGSTEVLAVDTKTQEVFTFGSLQERRRKWSVGVLAPNDCIYCSPLCDPSILVIDCKQRVVRTIGQFGSLDSGGFLWTTGTLGPDKRIYCSPLNAPSVLVIDPATDQYELLGDFSQERFKWNKATFAPDGRMYASPAMNRTVGLLVIETPGYYWTPPRSKFFPKEITGILRLLLLIWQRGSQIGKWGLLPKGILIDSVFSFVGRDFQPGS